MRRSLEQGHATAVGGRFHRFRLVMARTGQAAHPSHGAVGGKARHEGVSLPEHRPIAIERGEIALRRAVGGGEAAAQVEPAVGRSVDACRVGRVIVLQPAQLDGFKRVARRIADVHVRIRRAALQALHVAVEAVRLPNRGQRAVSQHGGIGRVFRARAAERRLPRIGEVGQRHLDRGEIRRRVGYARVRGSNDRRTSPMALSIWICTGLSRLFTWMVVVFTRVEGS